MWIKIDNFTNTIKNILKVIKEKLKTKADINTENVFNENITLNKKLFIKVNNKNTNILELIDNSKLQEGNGIEIKNSKINIKYDNKTIGLNEKGGIELWKNFI